MQVFVTAATGWAGSAVVQELIGAGHQVTGPPAAMTRRPRAHRGAGRPRHGRRLRLAQRSVADAVTHTPFNHDFSKFTENDEQDRRAIDVGRQRRDRLPGGRRRPIV
jgi:nucleoside-diphosphate-sugar epimerase